MIDAASPTPAAIKEEEKKKRKKCIECSKFSRATFFYYPEFTV